MPRARSWDAARRRRRRRSTASNSGSTSRSSCSTGTGSRTSSAAISARRSLLRPPVTAFISARVGNSLVLALAALVVLLPVSLVLGIWSGIRRDRADDHAISIVSLGLIALPGVRHGDAARGVHRRDAGAPAAHVDPRERRRALESQAARAARADALPGRLAVRDPDGALGRERGDAGGLRRDGAPERHPRASGRPAPCAAQLARPDGAGVRAHDPVPDRRASSSSRRSSPIRASGRGSSRPSSRATFPPSRAWPCSWPPSTS